MSTDSSKYSSIASDFLPEARSLLLPIWTKHGLPTRGLRTRGALFDAIVHQIAAWMYTAAANRGNADYYQSLVVKCGEYIGKEAYTQDDGGVVEDVLCDKVPELVRELVSSPRREIKPADLTLTDLESLGIEVIKELTRRVAGDVEGPPSMIQEYTSE